MEESEILLDYIRIENSKWETIPKGLEQVAELVHVKSYGDWGLTIKNNMKSGDKTTDEKIKNEIIKKLMNEYDLNEEEIQVIKNIKAEEIFKKASLKINNISHQYDSVNKSTHLPESHLFYIMNTSTIREEIRYIRKNMFDLGISYEIAEDIIKKLETLQTFVPSGKLETIFFPCGETEFQNCYVIIDDGNSRIFLLESEKNFIHMSYGTS